MRIRPPNKEYDPVAISERINEFWVNTHAYKRTKKSRSEGKKFYFVDGPPFTTDNFHLGLARNKILKDSILRFQRSQGFDVMDRPGYDMHGLPIVVKVEEMLGITNRKDIEELGIERFVETCQDYANDFKDKMTEQFMKLGIWMDWENPFLSTDPAYIESVWWSIKEAHKKDLLRKTKMVTGWCPRCETPLAQGEIIYKEKSGHSAYIKIPIKGRRDEYIIVWSTTPWTFAGALAVAVNPDLVYARVAIRQGGRKSTMIVLEDRVEEVASIANIEAYDIIDTIKGRDLEGLEYFHPLMADIQFHKSVEGEWAHKIIGLDTVHDSHTGAVYLAPGFGHYDYEAGLEFGLPIFSPVDERGIFTTEVGIKYASQGVDEASNSILAELKGIRFVLHDSMEPHTYGHCWRCESPIIHRSTEQWFLRVNDVKDIMLKTLKGTTWQPEEYMVRQHDWIIKANDWCISRQRYWGTPMPLWECITDVCGHLEVIGSLKSLKDSSSFKSEKKLHRPWIDNVNLECPKCGGLMKRVPDIIDVWFDSSVASWAQLGYPRKKKAFKELWPAEFIAEGQGQTKGWFQNQMTSGVMLFNKMPFKKALVHGWLYDENGHSISHSEAESSDPDTAIGLYGADALRFSLLKMEPWKSGRFNPSDVKRANRTLNILWNSYVFATTYMSMDDWDPKEHKFSKVKKNFKPEDQWIISKVESLTNNVKNEMNLMNTHKACQHIEEFIINDLSHWYIRIIRERMWQEGNSKDKEAAFVALHETLNRLTIISSPFIPYIAETIYQELDGTDLSVSMIPWPDADATKLAEGMEKNMKNARLIVETANKLRQENGLHMRWPVRKMTISASHEEIADAVNMFNDAIKKQTNVKELELVPGNQEWAGQELIVVPNPNVIGRAYSQWERKIARMLKVLPAREVKAKIETGDYTLGIEGQVIRILPSMVQFKTKLPEGVVAKEFHNGTMYFDTSIDDELTAEGFTRQITRRIQEMRKEMALDPEEYIKLSVSMSDDLLRILDELLENIADSTRANQMEIVEELGDEDYVVEWPIEDETVTIGITSLNIKKSMDEFTGVKGVDNELALAMVEAGITDSQIFMDTERELLLKIPGMSHSTLRKIKEYFETPEDLRDIDGDQRCPMCDGIVELGATNCHRCGKNLVGDDDMDIELVGDFEDEEEDEYFEEVVKEKVKVKKKKPKLEPELPPQPEDEIIKMATEEHEPSPEDLIASEIMDSIIDKPPAQKEGIVIPAPEELELSEEELPAPVKAEEELPTSKQAKEELELSEEELPTVDKPEEELPTSVETEAEELPQPAEEEIKPEESISEPADMPLEQEELKAQDKVATKGDIIDSDMDKSINAMAEAFELKHSVAKALYKGGYDSMESIENATEDELRAVKGVGKVTARRIKQKLSSEDTKMCSLCNAIVPAESALCERCGVQFVSQDEEDTRSKEKHMSTLSALDKKLKKQPSNAKLLHSKAMTLIDAGKEEEAITVINQGLEFAPKDKKLLKARDKLEKSKEIPEIPEPDKESQSQTSAKEAEEIPGAIVPVPSPEEKKPVEEGVKLKSSFTYLIPEERSAKTYKLFKQNIDKGMAGYCVTRTFPEKVRERYNLGETPILWLSNVAKEDAVRPKDLEKLSLSLEEFLSEQGGIVLLDGIEYLITNNNFITVLKLIQSLRDQVAINRSIMLLSVNPSTMDDHQINLLRREVDAVID